MIRSFAALKSLLAGLALTGCFVSTAPAAEPNIKMHRMQAGEVDGSGWAAAQSTEGGFVVNLPCAFNDYTEGPDKVDTSHRGRLYGLGCQRPDSVRFTAIRFELPIGSDGSKKMFDSIKSGKVFPNAPYNEFKFGDLQAIDFSMHDGQKCAWFRAVEIGPDYVLMIVEPIGVPCTDLAGLSKTFFDTLKVTTL